MKAKVLRAYIDKGTNEAHKVNAIVDVSKERFKELSERGFVAAVSDDDSSVKAENALLKKENAELKKDNESLSKEIAELKTIIEKAATAATKE